MNWKRREEHPELFEDGDQYLVTVPMSSGVWEYYVITVRCDEGMFEWEHNGNDWCEWSWDDVEFYIKMSDMPKFPKGATHDRA